MRHYDELTTLGRARRLRVLAERALEEYDLVPTGLRLLTNDTNGIFRVDTAGGERYVIRVGLAGHIGHSSDEVRAETEWLAALAAETDLLVPRPLPTRSGEPMAVAAAPGVPEPRNCVVFTWLDGRLLADRLTRGNVAALGRYVAELHRHGAAYVPTAGPGAPRYDRVFPFDEPVVLFEDRVAPPGLRAMFEEAAERVESLLGRVGTTPARLLHGDLHSWNVKVFRGRIAVFDFEDLMWGWPVQDLATTLYYFHGMPEYQALRGALADGYREGGGVWPDDEDIDTFMAGRSLVLANDVLLTPEWSEEIAPFFARSERRLEALLHGGSFAL